MPIAMVALTTPAEPRALPPAKALFVSPVPQDSSAVREALRGCQLNVAELVGVDSIEDACTRLQNEPYAAILVDLNRLDALALASRISELSPSLRVILYQLLDDQTVCMDVVAARLGSHQRRLDGPGEPNPGSIPATLSGRQLEILRHLASGLSVKEIAHAMQMTYKSVDSLKYRLMQRLQIHDRVGLARFAIRAGLVSP